MPHIFVSHKYALLSENGVSKFPKISLWIIQLCEQGTALWMHPQRAHGYEAPRFDKVWK